LSFCYKGKAVMEWKLIGLEDGTIAVDGGDFAFYEWLTIRKYSEIRSVYRPYTEHGLNLSSIRQIMSEALPVDVWNSKYPALTDWMENWE